MTIEFKQLFYGRGPSGYAVLGASPTATGIATFVERICEAVGTPGTDYVGEPFLLSVPEGESVVIICGRLGAPDGMGRRTLFFHALVAPKADLAAANTDAFSLFEQGVFTDKMPQGEIKFLCVDAHARPSAVEASTVFPAVFRSQAPSLDLVRRALGGRTLDCKWATYAFQYLDGFDVQVLPPRVSVPKKMSNAGETSTSRIPVSSGNIERRQPTVDRRPSAALKISLFFNLVFAVVCGLLLASRKSIVSITTKPIETSSGNIVVKTVTVPLSPEQRTEIGRAAVMEYLASLKLPEEVNMDELAQACPGIDNTANTEIKQRLADIFSFIHDLKTTDKQEE